MLSSGGAYRRVIWVRIILLLTSVLFFLLSIGLLLALLLPVASSLRGNEWQGAAASGLLTCVVFLSLGVWGAHGWHLRPEFTLFTLSKAPHKADQYRLSGESGGAVRGLKCKLPRYAAWGIGLACLAGVVAVAYLNELLIAHLPGDLGLWLREQQTVQAYQTERLFGHHSPPVLLIQMGLLALLTPLAEEYFFRGTLQTLLGKVLPPAGAVTITALTFTLFHLNAVGALPILALALLLGVMRRQTASLLPGILLHALNNAATVLIYYTNSTAPTL